MTIRKATYIFLALLISALALAFSNQHTRWLAFNGIAASQLSNSLLSQETVNTPDWAIDLIIVSSLKEHSISFSKHHSEYVYVYSPNNAPSSNDHHWHHLIGSWYVGKIKT